MISRRVAFALFLIAGMVAAGAGAGCSLENQFAPSLTGPSEFALSVTLSATPNQLPRDGSSQSDVTVTVRNASGNLVAGQRLSISTSMGAVSQSEVVTGSGGQASFALVAPESGAVGNFAVISVVPVGSNADNAVSRTLSIPLTGPSNQGAPTPDFDFSPTSPVVRETVAFDASKTTDEDPTPDKTDDDEKFRCRDACSYAWNFGDGGTASGRLATHQFTAVGTYQVNVTVTDPAGSTASKAKNVAIAQGTAPTASFTFSPTSPAVSETVYFTAETSRVGQEGRTITRYEWTFGDGSTATGQIVSHTFTAARSFTVTLTVTDNAGASASTARVVAVPQGTAPTSSFTFSPTAPGHLQTVNFTAEASRVGETSRTITSYQWRFGDGSTATGITTSHSYSVLGTFSVTLTVTDSAGSQGTSTQSVTVAIVAAPTVTLAVTPSPPLQDQAATFTATATPAAGHRITGFAWDFGDGTSQTTTSPTVTKTYQRVGTYVVTVTVTDNVGQTASVSLQFTIVGSGVTAHFTVSPTNPRNTDSVVFNASESTASAGAIIQEWEWDFGDGSGEVSDSDATISHKFPQIATARTYVVRLTVQDSRGRRATYRIELSVGAP